MTYTTKTRGSPTAPIVAEFRCPTHGVFSVTCARPAPDAMACPEVTGEDQHGNCSYCDELSPWCMSAPNVASEDLKVRAVVRGGDTDRRPGMLDTRPLAEGQSKKDWKAVQRKARESRRHEKLVKLGLVKKRIQVG